MSSVARTGFDPDLAKVASRNQLACRPYAANSIGAKSEHALPAVAPVRSVRRRLVAGLRRAVRRVVWPVVGPTARRTRSYLVADLRNELWLQSTLAANHVNHLLARSHHDLDRLGSAIERGNDETAIVMRYSQSIMQQLSDQIERYNENTSALMARLDALEAHAQLAETETVWRRDGLAPALARIETLSAEAVRRLVIPTRPGEVLVNTKMGFILCPTDDELVVAYLAGSGDPERGTRLVIEGLLSPGDVFVDAGANLGIHTLAAARAVEPGGRVIAFEPFGPTARLLRRSIAVNGHADVCEVHEVALSDHSGEQALLLGITSGHHSLNRPVTPSEHGDRVDVSTSTLDEVLGAGAKVDVIKIDVEGVELQVLAGASQIVDSNPEIVVIAEFGPIHLEQAGVSPHEWLAAFAAHGFEWRVIEPVTGALEEVDVERLRSFESCNLLFARTSKLADLVGSV